VVFLPLLPAGLWAWLRELGSPSSRVPEEEYPTLGLQRSSRRPVRRDRRRRQPGDATRLEAAGVEVHAVPLREVGENGSGGVPCLTRPILREA
jgi:N-dimethylarginine dimethylaminohydrolase